MTDASLIGTQRMTISVDAYDDGREPDGRPDRVLTTDVFMEADGTLITDLARIALIRDVQAQQREVTHD